MHMKQSRSEKEGKKYVEIKLKKRRTEKFCLEAKVGAGPHDLKEVDIVNESEPAAYSTLTEEMRTAMRKLIKEMARLCSVYNINF